MEGCRVAPSGGGNGDGRLDGAAEMVVVQHCGAESRFAGGVIILFRSPDSNAESDYCHGFHGT